MPRDRLLALYREAYQKEERETYRARTVMTDIKDEVLRSLTLPNYQRTAPTGDSQSRGRDVKQWLDRGVAADLDALLADGILVGDVWTDWPAGPTRQPLCVMWSDIVGLLGN